MLLLLLVDDVDEDFLAKSGPIGVRPLAVPTMVKEETTGIPVERSAKDKKTRSGRRRQGVMVVGSAEFVVEVEIGTTDVASVRLFFLNVATLLGAVCQKKNPTDPTTTMATTRIGVIPKRDRSNDTRDFTRTMVSWTAFLKSPWTFLPDLDGRQEVVDATQLLHLQIDHTVA